MPKLENTTWVSLLIIGIASLGTWHYSNVLLKAKSTDSWPSVTGQILAAEYTYNPVTRRSTQNFSYQYQVQGQSLNGQRVSWANTGRAGPSLFEAGDTISVYINPHNSEEAVLIRGSDTWTIIQISICLLTGLLGLWLFLLLYREDQANR